MLIESDYNSPVGIPGNLFENKISKIIGVGLSFVSCLAFGVAGMLTAEAEDSTSNITYDQATYTPYSVWMGTSNPMDWSGKGNNTSFLRPGGINTR